MNNSIRNLNQEFELVEDDEEVTLKLPKDIDDEMAKVSSSKTSNVIFKDFCNDKSIEVIEDRLVSPPAKTVLSALRSPEANFNRFSGDQVVDITGEGTVDSDKSSGVFDDLNTASNSTSDDDDMLDIVDPLIEDYFSEDDDEG